MANQIIDQENQIGSTGIGFGDLGSGRDYLFQGFIAQTTSVDAVSFRLDSVGSVGMAIWIDNADSNSNPTGTVLVGIGGYVEIANGDLSTTFKKYSLASAVTLTVGNRYVICMCPIDTTTHLWTAGYRDIRSSTANPYANGRRVHGDTAYTTFVAPDSGNADILFRTWSTVDTTRLYLNNDTAPYDPATERGAWNATAGYAPLLLDTAKSGANATIGIAETDATNNWDVLLAKFVTDALPANKTISGVMNIMAGLLESNSSANDRYHFHAYVTTGDSDTPRGTLVTDKIGGIEWLTTATSIMIAADVTTVNALTGDRIVVEIGYQAQNTGTTSYTGTLYYGGTGSDLTDASTDVTTLVGFVDFSTSGIFTASGTATYHGYYGSGGYF